MDAGSETHAFVRAGIHFNLLQLHLYVHKQGTCRALHSIQILRSSLAKRKKDWSVKLQQVFFLFVSHCPDFTSFFFAFALPP
jgi:hypothetical protein